MLNQGADACVELPVDLREILAILNAVLRREGRIKFVHTGALMPCIEYKELFIDPLRRQVKMRGQIVCLIQSRLSLRGIYIAFLLFIGKRYIFWTFMRKLSNEVGRFQ